MHVLKRTNAIAATGLMALGLTLFSGLDSRAADPIKLSMVGSWPPKLSSAADIGIKWMDTVNALGAGKVHITFKGSRDVIPTFDQPEALVRGLFDVWYGAGNYWAGVVPGGHLTEMSHFSIPDKGPGSELFKFVNKLFNEKGIEYLGHMSGEVGTGNHFMYTQKKISGIAGLKGMKMRVPPLTRFFVKAIGAEPVTMPPPEIYLALERGTVEGFTWPFYDGFTAFGWEKVSKFIIHEPLYRNGIAVKMHKGKWDALPADVQSIFYEATRKTQAWSQGWVSAFQSVQLNAMKKGGMKVIELSKAEKVRWRETADTSLWAHFKDVMKPDDYKTARRLLGAM